VQKHHFLGSLFPFHNNEVGQHIVMPGQILGGAVDDNICPPFDRPLEEKRGGSSVLFTMIRSSRFFAQAYIVSRTVTIKSGFADVFQ